MIKVQGKPWWWPKSPHDVERLLDRIDRYRHDYRFYMLQRFVVFAVAGFFAFGMSLSFLTLLLILGKDVGNASTITTLGVNLVGVVCALLAYSIDHDVFREMSEVFLGIPLSRRTKRQLQREFHIEL